MFIQFCRLLFEKYRWGGAAIGSLTTECFMIPCTKMIKLLKFQTIIILEKWIFIIFCRLLFIFVDFY